MGYRRRMAIISRQCAAGPRAAPAGTGLDVWEVVETVRLVGDHLDRAARSLEIDVALVREALGGGSVRVALDRLYPSSLARRLRELRHDAVALAERPELAALDDDAALAGDERLAGGRRWLEPPAGCPFWPRAS